MTTSQGSQHLDDGALVRILDRQPQHDDVAAHLPGCARCSARYREIERRSRTLHGLLERARSAEPAPPTDLLERARKTAARRAQSSRRWVDRPLLQAAAVTAILFAGALTAEPVREWLGATARQLVTALNPATQPEPSAAPIPVTDDAVEITIVPTGARLLLRFDAREPGAVARILFHGRTDASGQVLGDAPAPGLVALPDGFRIRNAGARGTRYRFTAPAGMPVEVRVGERVMTTLRGESGDARDVTLEHRPGS